MVAGGGEPHYGRKLSCSSFCDIPPSAHVPEAHDRLLSRHTGTRFANVSNTESGASDAQLHCSPDRHEGATVRT